MTYLELYKELTRDNEKKDTMLLKKEKNRC